MVGIILTIMILLDYARGQYFLCLIDQLTSVTVMLSRVDVTVPLEDPAKMGGLVMLVCPAVSHPHK